MSPDVRVQRERAGETAAAVVDGGHERLGAARAWLEVGTKLLDGGLAGEAWASALDGLEELGEDYAAPTAIDDTTLKLAAAEEQYDEGNVADAASVALRVLETRVSLYEARNT